MRFRVFGKIIYIRKGVLLIVLAVAAIAAALVIYGLEKGRKLPEIQHHTAASETKDNSNDNESGNDNDGQSTAKDNATDEAGEAPDSSTMTGPASTPMPAASKLAVHLTGAVAEEGVFRVEQGAIVQDIVDMCGGLLPEADTYCINLAMKVNDGMRIHIPYIYDENKKWLLDVGYASGSASSGNGSEGNGEMQLVNINTASVNELITLNGIGESTARDIIAFREEHGRFETIEDIMKVPGIKEARFNRIKKYITV